MNKKQFFIVICVTLLNIFMISAQTVRPIVNNISATGQDSLIIISWNLPEDSGLSMIANLEIYRSKTPYTSFSQVKENEKIATLSGTDTLYKDKVSDYFDYYYAIISVQKNGLLYDVIIPSLNSTVYPISRTNQREISNIQAQPIQQEKIEGIQEGQLRDTPLPFLSLIADDTKTADEISQETLEFISKLQVSNNTKTKPTLQIFDNEKDSNVTGDNYILYEAVNSFFKREQWKNAETDLITFLKTNHNEDITARANFYLGQCFYFQGKYRDALNCFLASEKIYPAPSKKWIKIVIDDLPINTKK